MLFKRNLLNLHLVDSSRLGGGAKNYRVRQYASLCIASEIATVRTQSAPSLVKVAIAMFFFFSFWRARACLYTGRQFDVISTRFDVVKVRKHGGRMVVTQGVAAFGDSRMALSIAPFMMGSCLIESRKRECL